MPQKMIMLDGDIKYPLLLKGFIPQVIDYPFKHAYSEDSHPPGSYVGQFHSIFLDRGQQSPITRQTSEIHGLRQYHRVR